ncbi:hypothetical protein CP532_4129 [Ophiocordyceps camponoti-leonardi (nom. inval.)]|nr:hypothetical protein CP532_4129 [Ophiocordyceps camponoti-leonardi (nom. inval.)]
MQQRQEGADEGASPGTSSPTKEATAVKPQFSWLQPHPIFVILLIGPEEQPFGIQKDFLCHRSEFYRQYFDSQGASETVEHLVRLPEFAADVFGLAQNYLYTGVLLPDEAAAATAAAPSYESLVSLWKLGYELGIDGLCDKALDAMTECRRLTQRIPAAPLLIQVWRDAPEGSSIRVLLLSWAAEYMRRSDARAEFAKSLPQEVLSELVVAMSSVEQSSPAVVTEASSVAHPPPVAAARKSVHYLTDEEEEDTSRSVKTKKTRRTSEAPTATTDRKMATPASATAANRGPPVGKGQKRRSSSAVAAAAAAAASSSAATTTNPDGRAFTTAQKLDFCADLLTRMLSGPGKKKTAQRGRRRRGLDKGGSGFWTRLVGPFKDPVEPMEDGVPDYLEKIKRPMDLGTIKAKVDRREYKDEEEFLADVRQIFENCFTYWKKGDPMWAAGEKLQKTFEEKYSHMNRWISKMGGEEGE